MSSTWGNNIKVSIFGQSHSEAIGVCVDGFPAGEGVDVAELERFLRRRAPGHDPMSTARCEADRPKILCGVVNGVTCGAPFAAIIENTDTRSGDYADLIDVPRPSHADYPAHVKYKGFQDVRGGGHFSGRLTAPLCIAGGICLQILRRRGIEICAHIASVGNVEDERFTPLGVSEAEIKTLSEKKFAVINDAQGAQMQQDILRAKSEGDSIGGSIECIIQGVPAGIGGPLFGGLDGALSVAMFGVPAVKGVEFGDGFACTRLRGSEHNDPYRIKDGRVVTKSNHAGGILGGISTGMPILLHVAIKPTASIAIEQESVSLSAMENRNLTILGRHDPCIVPRAVPVIEAAAAIAILDALPNTNI
jgi:chorismate synthase